MKTDYLKYVLWLLLGSVFGQAGVYAQMATVRGLVKDATDGQALISVNVVMESTDGLFGVATDKNGFFALSNLPPNTYQMKVSFIGYTTFIDSLDLNFGDAKRISITLSPEKVELENVEVSAERMSQNATGSEAGLYSIRPADMQRIPSIGISKDLTNYLLTIPGVVSASDRGGQLFVRGGTPTQNLVLIDGIPLYQPFHIVGGYSAFPENIISYTDVFTGGYGARFGGRMSSIIDVAARNGNKNKAEGAISFDPFFSTAYLEGPLLKNKLSFIGSARSSRFNNLIPENLRPNIPYEFEDKFLKLHAFISPTSSISALGIESSDLGNLGIDKSPKAQVGWKNQAVGIRLLHLPESFPAISEFQFSTTRYQSTFGLPEAPDRYSKTTGYRTAINFHYLMGKWEARFGLFFRVMRFEYLLDRAFEEGEYVAEGGTFLEGNFTFFKTLNIEPGIRIHTFPSQGNTSIEPRFRAVWKVSKMHKLNLAWGIFHQQIIGLNDEKDIGSIFTAWGPSSIHFGVPQAQHFILGWSGFIRPWLQGTLEGYQKKLSDLTVFTGNFGFEPATGVVEGVDVSATAFIQKLYGKISYSYTNVQYETPSAIFHPDHDRRHQFTAVASYQWNNILLNAQWQFGTGFPFTRLIGFDNELDVNVRNRNYFTDSGIVNAYYETPFLGRLPDYHRMDISAEKPFRLNEFHGLLFLGIQNIYNQANLFYYDLWKGVRINQLPRTFSLGIKLGFK